MVPQGINICQHCMRLYELLCVNTEVKREQNKRYFFPMFSKAVCTLLSSETISWGFFLTIKPYVTRCIWALLTSTVLRGVWRMLKHIARLEV